jgi:2-dehydropantoate 2-reductase
MRVAIFGAGAVGAYVGGRLAQAGVPVAFLARGDHLHALASHGLRVGSPQGDFVVQPWLVTDDPTVVGTVDVVVVGVKTWQLPEVVRALPALVGPDTCVVPLQNGVEAPTQLAQGVGAQAVLGGCCRVMSVRVAPGHIQHRGGIHPYLLVGELDNRHSARAERLCQVLDQAGVTAAMPPDIQVAMWEKFVQVAAFSGVGAVTRAPVGTLCSLPETRALLEQVMQEIVAVARAQNIALPADVIPTAMAQLASFPPGGTNSTQRDLMAGRPSELEAHAGAVVRLGQAMGVPTPLNTFLYHSLLPLELHARGHLVFPT